MELPSENGLCNGACKRKASHSEFKVLLRWSAEQESSAPLAMDLGSCTAVGHTAYFKPEVHNTVHAYNASTSLWTMLPTLSVEGFTLVVARELLTAIGGYGADEVETNTLLSLTSKEGGASEWTQHFPPMPSSRCFPAAVSSGALLLVAGGLAGDDEPVDTVELLELETQRWLTAAPLPLPLCSASAVACGDRLYVVGGFDGNDSRQTVFTCSLRQLHESAKPLGGGAKASCVWERVADSPVTHSTAVEVGGQLVVFGGKLASGEATGEVFAYDTDADAWSVVSQMAAPRSQCLVAALEGGSVMVVGGWREYKLTDTVDFATF